MTDGSIKYYQLTASSEYQVSRPENARYDSEGDAWCATIADQSQFIRVSIHINGKRGSRGETQQK